MYPSPLLPKTMVMARQRKPVVVRRAVRVVVLDGPLKIRTTTMQISVIRVMVNTK
jgi:hypothetical protein